MRLKDLWALQLQKLPELVALVEQADEQANSSKFADALMQLLSSVVLSTRAKSYIAGLELLAVPALTNNEAIVVSAIALVSRKAVSSQTGGSVLIAVNEAMQAVVTAQPTEAVLAKLIEQVRWSRSATARYAALATLGLGFEAFVLAAETLPVVEGFGDALLELVITTRGDLPQTKLIGTAVLARVADKDPQLVRSIAGDERVCTNPLLKAKLAAFVGDTTPARITPARVARRGRGTPGRSTPVRKFPIPAMTPGP